MAQILAIFRLLGSPDLRCSRLPAFRASLWRLRDDLVIFHAWVVPGLPYIIVYQVRENEELVSVDAVFHGAQDRKKR
jgi:hypothetical protein